MKLKLFWSLGLLILLLAPWVHGMDIGITDGRIQGRIYNGSSLAGVPFLTVKLIPPKNSSLPEKVTVTDADGGFDFQDATMGRYLLEVYQGLQLLYRNVIDTRNNARFTVSLRPRTQ